MIDDPRCPVCGVTAWLPIGTQTFRRDDEPRSDYLALRRKVLFELWSPDADVFIARFVLCQDCGFVCYRPRPSADEIHRKYALIAELSPEVPSKRQVHALDRIRSEDLFRYASPHLRGRRILDFGGGNGALLHAFVESGLSCSVVDYTKESVPGVTRLGATLDELDDDATFDAVLASHVLEHVAEPVEMIGDLAARLTDGGVLIVEVPLEILGGPPKMREPVTHVSFFCRSSLAAALRRAGLEVVTCDARAARFESGSVRHAVRAIARKVDAPPTYVKPGSREAEQLLGAGWVGKALYALRHPRVTLSRKMARG